jgi:hypothetical protein
VVREPFISCFAVLAIVSCSGRDPVDPSANAGAATLPDMNAPAPSSSGEPHGNTQPARPLPSPVARIPASLQGRWGLTPAACIPGRSDAKGLLVVSAEGLRFHESQAVPAVDVDSDSGSISGKFAFAGEGRSWTKYEALKVDNHTLVRTEMNPTASFTYAKCA